MARARSGGGEIEAKMHDKTSEYPQSGEASSVSPRLAGSANRVLQS